MSKKSELVRGFGLAMSIGAAMDEIRREHGVTEEEFHILGTPEGRVHLEKMVLGLKAVAQEPLLPSPPPVYLRRLFEGERITLDPTDGTRTIPEVTDVFTGFIDSDFAKWRLGVPTQPTGKTEFVVYEQIRDGTFRHNFGSLYRPFVELCSTPHQVIEFAVKHRSRLRSGGYGTFFLLRRADGEFFVADVYVCDGGRLCVNVYQFSGDGVWDAECQLRFVVPQLVPLAA